MASLEQAERVGGAAFLGVPAFDAFVYALDYYARVELLVKLHSALPSAVLDPVLGFVCLCVGLTLLYLSNRRQLRRVSQSIPSQGYLVDSSGKEIISAEKPQWLLPVLVVFLCALVATPVVAIFYSLAYKGEAPKIPIPPSLPYFAYAKTEQPKPTAKPSPRIAPVAVAPNGIANAAPNFGTQTVNNIPPEWRISSDDKSALKEILSQQPTKVFVRTWQNDPAVEPFARDFYEILIASGWRIGPIGFSSYLTFGEKPPAGVTIRVRGEPLLDGQEMTIPLDSPIGALGKAFEILKIPVNLRPSKNEKEGLITLDFGPKPKN